MADIWELASKPIATDQHILREFTGMWQGLCLDLLSHPAPIEQEGPDRSDLFYMLPKLVLARPQRAETRKARLRDLNQQFRLASQGEWQTLMSNALTRPDTFREADDMTGLTMAADGLSAQSQGQLGEAWRQLRAPPLAIGPKQTWPCPLVS